MRKTTYQKICDYLAEQEDLTDDVSNISAGTGLDIDSIINEVLPSPYLLARNSTFDNWQYLEEEKEKMMLDSMTQVSLEGD